MARKSKKVDFVNVNDLPGGSGAQVPVPVKAVCYRAGLYARLSEETEENRERATVETQMELLRKFAAEREDMVIAKEYADISCTGTNFERPGFEEMMRDFKARTGIDRAESTYKQYEVLHDQLKDFLKIQYHASDIPFTELDLPFIESLDFYFRVRRKMKARTVKSRLVLFNKVVLLALHRNIISRHPFAGFETEKITAQDKSLTPEELERLLSTPLKSATQRFIRDMFVFSVFTGISYADLKKLAWKDIIRENDGSLWISADRQKTKTAFNVKLLDIPVQIMDYYEGLAEGDSVFPAMSLGQVNVGLKRIARHCKINRALTYHMGRYTFASQICLSQGVPIESVSRMLGHTNIQTTQRYARLNNGKIISDMKMFAERVANEFNFIP